MNLPKIFHPQKKDMPQPQSAIPFLDLLYCPQDDLNHIHVLAKSRKTAICSGCGEIISRAKEINFRKKLAKTKKINRYKAFIERKI
ncbi:unnamed protein product [marine sediment metagenome]|uniref:Uncharacterized protein n=1 Tax=marine sediment metagenome TaxID=412755 RepID=X1GXF0_9ZZZZ